MYQSETQLSCYVVIWWPAYDQFERSYNIVWTCDSFYTAFHQMRHFYVFYTSSYLEPVEDFIARRPQYICTSRGTVAIFIKRPYSPNFV